MTPRHLLIFVLFFIGCQEKRDNNSFNPQELTEEELYTLYGLEAPSDVYSTIDSILTEKKFNYDKICDEPVNSTLIGVTISIDSLKITSVEIRPTEYSYQVNKVIEQAFIDLKKELSLYKSESHGDFNFRLDMDKFCKKKNFNPTPQKDSTLETKPIIKSIEKNNNSFKKEGL